MSVKMSWILEKMEKLSPSYTAMEWDNVGLLVGDAYKTVNTVMTALDLTDDVLTEAIARKAELVVTHHPFIFFPVKSITNETALGRRIMAAIQNNIAVYCAHTNLDMAVGGTNDCLFDWLGLVEKEPLEDPIPDCEGFAMGRVGRLAETMALKDLAFYVKGRLGLSTIRYAGPSDKLIQKVGLCTGAASETKFFKQAVEKGCDAYITGDIKYHDLQAALDLGLCLIDGTHYATEVLIAEKLMTYLQDEARQDAMTLAVFQATARGCDFENV